MDRLSAPKNLFLFVIVSVLLMVQEIKTRSTGRITGDNHHSLHSLVSENMKHLRSRFHLKSFARHQETIDDESAAKPVHPLRHHHKRHLHTLIKRNDGTAAVKYHDHITSHEVRVEDAQSTSVCNYTVVPVASPEGYELPKNLVHIRCNHRGSTCHGSNDVYDAFCCKQTYTWIKITTASGVTKKIRIDTGCVCAGSKYVPLSSDLPQFDFNQE